MNIDIKKKIDEELAMLALAGTDLKYYADHNLDLLMHAARKGHTRLVKLLIESGAKHIDEALAYASSEGHIDIIKLLLEAGADIHSGTDYPLRVTCAQGRVEILNLLIKYNADAKVYDKDAVPFYATPNYPNKEEIIKILIDNGADASVTKKYL